MAAADGPPAATDPVSFSHRRRLAEVTPLSPDRYRYQLTIGGTTLEKLRLAKDMLRRALPSGDDEAILDRALTALITELARRRFGKIGAGDKTGSSSSPAPDSGRVGATDSRHVPAAVKRAVWLRDLGRCAFLGTSGRRCAERAFVEFHHLRPHAVGGEAIVGNIELRCRRHNGYEARQHFAREPVGKGSTLRDPVARRGRLARSAGRRPFVPERIPRDHEVVSPRAGALTTSSRRVLARSRRDSRDDPGVVPERTDHVGRLQRGPFRWVEVVLFRRLHATKRPDPMARRLCGLVKPSRELTGEGIVAP